MGVEGLESSPKSSKNPADPKRPSPSKKSLTNDLQTVIKSWLKLSDKAKSEIVNFRELVKIGLDYPAGGGKSSQ